MNDIFQGTFRAGTLTRAALVLGVTLFAACAQNGGKPGPAASAAGGDNKEAVDDQVEFFVNHARNGKCDDVAKDLKAGVPIDRHDALDQTALIAAVSHNSIECTKLLLDHGADVKITDNAGWTPLIFAAYFGGSDEMLNLLLDHGSDINAQNDRGITALYMASAAGHEPQVKLLLARGADRSIATKNGYTPLRAAQMKSLAPIVALLDPSGKSSDPAASNLVPAAPAAK